MNLLSMVEARLPAGFRFHPRDDELVCEYLRPKASGGGLYSCPAAMVDVDLNKCEPWDLPGIALVGKKEWYFFSLKDKKYATGHRTNRATLSGYWKATGKDRRVTRRGLTVGMRKTLVFYIGRAPKGKKTEWVMHEFRIEGLHDPPKFNFKEDWVLCRVFYKSRTMLAKLSTENYYDDTSSSTLPPLSDACILFNQSLPHPEGFEQVPCFSDFTSISPLNYPLVERSMQTKSFAQLGALPMASDEKVVAAVVNQFTKLEGSQRSSEVCLPDTGHPSVWNPFEDGDISVLPFIAKI